MRIRIAATLTFALLLGLLPATGAAALSQYCGKDAIAVEADYSNSLSNGHPSADLTDVDGWNGTEAAFVANNLVFAFERLQTASSLLVDIYSAIPFDEDPSKYVKPVFVIVDVVLGIIVEIAKTVAQSIEHRTAQVDTCSGTLAGDLGDAVFVALMEEELARIDTTGPTTSDDASLPPGVQLVPSSMYLLPQDGTPAWQSDASLYQGYGNHASLGIFYTDGVLNADYFGVAATVRNEIAYLEASGIHTGRTETITDPFDPSRTTTVLGAGDLWRQAMEHMRVGNLREAHIGFARAYQRAVTATPAPGAEHQPADTTPPPDPSPPPPPPPPPGNPWG